MTATGRTLFRWAEASIKAALGDDVSITKVEDFQSGIVLGKLIAAISGTPPLKITEKSNKLATIGNIEIVLKHIASFDVRVTCSPTDIYDGNENMILGLLWVLILKFQVTQRADVLSWVSSVVSEFLSQQGIQVTVENSLQSGVGFVALVNFAKPGTINLQSVLNLPRTELLRKCFTHAQDLQIPDILLPEDHAFDERSLLTYLSYFYNKYKGVTPGQSQEPAPSIPPVNQEEINRLLAKIEDLEKELQLLKETNDSSNQSLQEKDSKITELQQEITSQQEERQTHLTEIQELKSKNQQLQESLDAANTLLAERDRELKQSNDLRAEIIFKTTNEMRELNEIQAGLTKELEQTKAANQVVEKKIQELNLKLPFFVNSGSSAPPPEGEVTLVFTDVQSSTDQWETRPESMAKALAIHNKLMRSMIDKFSGYEVKTEGDAFMIAFNSPVKAVEWCLETQVELLKQKWPEDTYHHESAAIEVDENGQEIYRGLRVRMGVHTGTPTAERDPVTNRMDYFGPMVNRAARVESTAFGGQIVVSGETYQAISDFLAENLDKLDCSDLGSHRLKGLKTDTQLYQILPKSLLGRKFPKFGTVTEEPKPPPPDDLLQALYDENAKLKARLETLEAEAERFRERAAELNSWLASHQSQKHPKFAVQLEAITKDVGMLMKSREQISMSLIEVHHRNSKSLETLKEVTAKLVSAETRERERSFEVFELVERVGSLEQQLQTANNEIDVLSKELDELRTKKKSILGIFKESLFDKEAKLKETKVKGKTKKKDGKKEDPPEPPDGNSEPPPPEPQTQNEKTLKKSTSKRLMSSNSKKQLKKEHSLQLQQEKEASAEQAGEVSDQHEPSEEAKTKSKVNEDDEPKEKKRSKKKAT